MTNSLDAAIFCRRSSAVGEGLAGFMLFWGGVSMSWVCFSGAGRRSIQWFYVVAVSVSIDRRSGSLNGSG